MIIIVSNIFFKYLKELSTFFTFLKNFKVLPKYFSEI
jgi:hypothetical protein